jgi:hypothetical protein
MVEREQNENFAPISRKLSSLVHHKAGPLAK